MRTIQATVRVGSDRKVTVQLPPDVEPGGYNVVVLIAESPLPEESRQPMGLSPHPVGLASDTLTFQREDLYGDDGR